MTTPLESTAHLLEEARRGDATARDRLAKRYIPILLRLAHGRLPSHARSLLDTDDLVQNTLVRALSHLDRFEPKGEGAFLAYLRRILVNHIVDEVRHVRHAPTDADLRGSFGQSSPSPLEAAMGAEMLRAYEAALVDLPDLQRQAVILRMELGFAYQEIAEALGRPSANAARMLVARGLIQLAEAMREHGGKT